MSVRLVVCCLLLGCAATPRVSRPRELAASPGRTGPFATLEESLRGRLGDAGSGFQLLDANEEALRWRLALVDSARHSLDLMTFLWWGDEAGELLLKRVLDAADRGVKVRLVVDDMTTIDDGKRLRLRDVSNAAIDAHPNIELRVFNPWSNREAVGRAVEFVGDFSRLNQRMHNKALVIDNRAAIVGGRNLGNEYFGLSDTFNFRDVDVLAVGPAAREVSGVFDRYWNSQWVVPQQQLEGGGTLVTYERERQGLEDKLKAAPALTRFPLAEQDWSREVAALAKTLHLGTARAVTDTPEEDSLTHHMPNTIRALFAEANREVLVANAYVIPDEVVFARTANEVKRGVRFLMLTNSLASTDAAGVHAHYTEWRPRLVTGGVELYELRHDAALRQAVADTPPVTSGFVGLHAKVVVVDRERVLIGSMNLDPRSWAHNTEMGLVIDCAPLARELGAAIDRDVRPENAWRIDVDAQGQVSWRAGDQVRFEAPARDESQRTEELLHLLLPADLY
ncbi:MAG: phospholipase D family protein [Myxococcaceae bacterium]|jgi:putative cardiolipin synthase|nr:phospholipase D family protein [Myxococcaceae bacterium]MCA3016860.1 phospholipase D family protein [Myxococcaceae bacterium]